MSKAEIGFVTKWHRMAPNTNEDIHHDRLPARFCRDFSKNELGLQGTTKTKDRRRIRSAKNREMNPVGFRMFP